MTKFLHKIPGLRSGIGRRMILYILLFSSMITFIGTGFQLYLDYARDIKSIDTIFEQVESSYLSSINNSLWVTDDELLRIQLEGILRLPDIQFISVCKGMTVLQEIGIPQSKNIIERTISLDYTYNDQTLHLGELNIVASLKGVYSRIFDRVLLIFIVQMIKTFLVSLFIFIIFYQFVGKHIISIASFAELMSFESMDQPFFLNRKFKSKKPDELDQLVSSFNRMQENLMRDINRKKIAEKKLQESEERFRAVATNTPDHILVQDQDLRYEWVLNPQLGLSEKDMIGKTDFEFLNKEDAQNLTRIKRGVLDSGNPKFLKVPLISSSGDVQFFEGSYIPRHDSEGKINGLIGYFRNETEKIKNEEALRKSEEKYHDLYDNAPDMFASVCVETKTILECNETLTNALGYAKEEIIGCSIFDIYTPDSTEYAKKKVFPTFQKTGTIIGEELNLQRKDGSTINVTLNVSAIRDESGNILSSRSVWHDITEQKKIKSQLSQAQKMESIGTLAGGIAHDFNNILSSIIGFTELALGGAEKGSELEDDLQEVRIAGLRAKDLVKQILTFARQSDEAVKPIQVNIIAKEVLKFIKSSIPSTIQIKYKIISDSFIMGSPTQIHQVLMNLCTNAAQAMEEKGGILEVSVDDTTIDRIAIPDLNPGEYIEIKVTDTGMGISSQHIHTIFEPYFTTKPVGEGTGMGLAVVHGIVENYGGQITVDSTIGKGTCFSIYLPITKKRKIHTYSEKEDLPLGNENILFVDDEAPIAKMGSKILEQLGYTVTTRTNSVEALELFRSKPQVFDLVVTDMTMPNMTGDKLAGELMKIRSDIPVVLCTGYSKKILEENAAEFGIKALAHKPIGKAGLAKTVRKVLDEAK